jgi:hypothetical protein
MRLGMVFGICGCVCGVLGMLTLGTILIPLGALCTVISLWAGVASGSGSGIVISLLSAVLVLVGFITAPALWVAFGLVPAHP